MKRKIKTKDKSLLNIIDDEIEYIYEDTSHLYRLTVSDYNFIHFMFTCMGKERMITEQNPKVHLDQPYRCVPIYRNRTINNSRFMRRYFDIIYHGVS